MKKRKSPYNLIDVMNKFNCDEKTARNKIEKHRLKTLQSLVGFIARYGEIEGKEKYNIFVDKSKNTLENFKKRYGDSAEEKWNTYLTTKESRSDSYFQKKYGDSWEEEKNKFITIWKYKLTLPGYIDKHGDILGPILYEEMIKKKIHTLDSFMAKYGEADGTKKYLHYRMSKDSSSLEFFINKYGEEFGTKQYQEKNKKCSPIYVELKKLYGESTALVIYEEYLKSKEHIAITKIKSEIRSNFIKVNKFSNPTSKSSFRFFEELEIVLNRKLQFGRKRDELKLFDPVNIQHYLYDCYDIDTNTVLEYNGSAFHYHPSFKDDWVSCFGETKETIIKRDQQKLDFAMNTGYNVIVIWDFEVSSLNRRYNKIIELKGKLNETV